MELKNLLPSRHGNVSWWAFAQTVVPLVLVCAGLVWALLHFVHSAPPHSLTITSGPKGSNFESIAQRYARILARSGIKLNVVPSQGSLENLQRMTDPKSHVDIALVQSGVTTNPDNDDDLESLGGMFYQPLLIFYRSPKPLQRLSELSSQRIAIGPEGSGTRLSYSAKATVGGKLAQIGSRLIDGVAKKMADDFFVKFNQTLSPAHAEVAVPAAESHGAGAAHGTGTWLWVIVAGAVVALFGIYSMVVH